MEELLIVVYWFLDALGAVYSVLHISHRLRGLQLWLRRVVYLEWFIRVVYLELGLRFSVLLIQLGLVVVVLEVTLAIEVEVLLLHLRFRRFHSLYVLLVLLVTAHHI